MKERVYTVTVRAGAEATKEDIERAIAGSIGYLAIDFFHVSPHMESSLGTIYNANTSRFVAVDWDKRPEAE